MILNLLINGCSCQIGIHILFPRTTIQLECKRKKIIGTGIDKHSSSTHFLPVLECAIIKKMH